MKNEKQLISLIENLFAPTILKEIEVYDAMFGVVSFDEFAEQLECLICEDEIIGCFDAMNFLTEHDQGLYLSIEIIKTWRNDLDLNCEKLASIIQEEKRFEAWHDLKHDVQTLFENLA